MGRTGPRFQQTRRPCCSVDWPSLLVSLHTTPWDPTLDGLSFAAGAAKRIVRDANYPDDTHLSVIWGGGAPWEYVIRQDGRSSNVFVNLLSGEVVELDGRVVMLNRAQGRVVLLAERQLWVAELCDQGARFKLPLGTVGAGAVRRLRICGNWIAFDGKLVEITHPSSVLPYDGTATAVSNEGSVLTGKILHGHLLGPLRWIDASAK